jgi:uncharacterized protein YkwD
VSRLIHTALLTASLLLGGAAVAQELPGSSVAGDPVTYVAPQSHIVVKVTRFCRGRVCVKVVHVNEVLDDIVPAPTTNPSAPIPVEPLAPPEQVQDLQAQRADPPLVAVPARRPGPTCGSAEETAAWRLLNAYRTENGLAALACDTLALKVARGHSRDMCDRRYFAHYTPEGTAPWDRLRTAGAKFRQAGENIAVGYDTAQGVHDGWVGSDGHRNNMLNAVWTRAAVGLVDCNGNRYWTQMFAR